jgi:5-methylcytosine-specific restriction endonuclease McrA
MSNINYCKCGCGVEIKFGKTWFWGHHAKGRHFKLSDEAKERIRQSKLGAKNPRFGKPGTHLGLKMSEETKEKVRLARAKQAPLSPESRKKLSESLRRAYAEGRMPNYRGGTETRLARRLIQQRNREAKKRENGGSFTLQEWENLKKSVGYMCLCCKKCEPIIKLTADHIIPISKGGLNVIDNIQPLCKSCNSIKHTKDINYLSIYYQTVKTQS